MSVCLSVGPSISNEFYMQYDYQAKRHELSGAAVSAMLILPVYFGDLVQIKND